MKKILDNYVEKLYAGWLGKVIGVRFGAPIEGFEYDRILKLFGDNIVDYIIDYKDFAADDDTNGPMFFIRALEDYDCSSNLTAQDIANTLLNYTSYEHGFFWWGRFGISTEHTAYLNLRSGIPAPRSGSIEQNGKSIAEQIGGQIFIDSWGLVNPGNPALAAEFAAKAASVTHGGNGIYGGMFVAAAIAAAFTAKSVNDIIETALSYIPKECEYTRVTRAVMSYYQNDELHSWRSCFEYVKDNFGYDKYPGACHIIPNAAVMILSLLYGEEDFDETIGICNMCGWDTDCNVGNIGTIIGTYVGLEKINYEKWRKPINDFIVCSGSLGSLNIVDLPQSVAYLARLAYKLADEEPTGKYGDFVKGILPKFNFVLPNSTHGFRVVSTSGNKVYNVENAGGFLELSVDSLEKEERISLFHKTYYRPKDFHDDRYNPCTSPIFYPGQTFSGYVKTENVSVPIYLKAYVKDSNHGEYYYGDEVALGQDWQHVKIELPYLSGVCIDETGVIYYTKDSRTDNHKIYIRDFDINGKVNYEIDYSKECMDYYAQNHIEVSQMTNLKGIWKLDNGVMYGSCHDYGEVYTGMLEWENYKVTAKITPVLGEWFGVNFRVQGSIKSYCAGFSANNKLQIRKNNNGYSVLAEVDFDWNVEQQYEFDIIVEKSKYTVCVDGIELLTVVDSELPYRRGCVGFSLRDGSKMAVESLKVTEA